MRALMFFTCLLAIALPAQAEKGHVHGEGGLEVVIDKESLSLRLELPLDVAVGFERAPRDDKEKAALAAAQQALANPARCRSSAATNRWSMPTSRPPMNSVAPLRRH
jgi:hypothetical protein